VATVATPIVLLDSFLLLVILYLWRRQKEPRRRLWWFLVAFFLFVLSSSAPVAYLALRSLEWDYPPSNDIPPDVGAIVVLAGSVRTADRVRAQPELGPNTLYRCLHAASLHRTSPDIPILVSGGVVEGEGSPAAATVMCEFLLTQGVKETLIILEKSSQNTYENAVESCKLLQERNVRRIVLVTDASHMLRASSCFRKQGMEVAPSPCNHIANEYHFAWMDLIPDANSAVNVSTAWHEWLGMAFYRVRGRL